MHIIPSAPLQSLANRSLGLSKRLIALVQRLSPGPERLTLFKAAAFNRTHRARLLHLLARLGDTLPDFKPEVESPEESTEAEVVACMLLQATLADDYEAFAASLLSGEYAPEEDVDDAASQCAQVALELREQQRAIAGPIESIARVVC